MYEVMKIVFVQIFNIYILGSVLGLSILASFIGLSICIILTVVLSHVLIYCCKANLLPYFALYLQHFLCYFYLLIYV